MSKAPTTRRRTAGKGKAGKPTKPPTPVTAARESKAPAPTQFRAQIRKLQEQAVEAQQAYSYEQAIELFSEALERSSRHPGSIEPGVEYALLAGRAACYRRIGNSEAASNDFDSMARMAKREGHRAHEIESLNQLAQAVINRGDFKVAERKAKSALRLARSLADRKLEADSLISLSEWKRAVGDPGEAQALLEKAIGLYREFEDRAGEANSLRRLGRLSVGIGETAKAHGYLNEALPLYRALGDLEGEAHTLNSLALSSSNHYETRTLGEQALAIFEKIGDVDGQSTMFNNLGLMYANLGLYQTAGEYTSRAVEMAKRAQARLLTATYLESLGRSQLDYGELASAQATLQEGLDLSLEIGHSHNEAYYRLGLGRLALARRQVDLAQKQVQAAVDYFRELSSPSELAVSLAWLGYIQLQAGDWESAHRASSEAVAQIEALGDVSWDYPPQDVWWLHYQVLKAAPAGGSAPAGEGGRSSAAGGDPALDFGQLTDTYAWMVLQRARQVALSGIANLSDEGLRRNYLNKVEINRQIIGEWVQGAAVRGLNLEIDQARPGNLQEQLKRMLAIGARMNERRDLEGLLEFVMDQLVELSGAERVVLSFLDESGKPQVSAARGQLSASGEIPAGAALLFESVVDSMRPDMRQGVSSSHPEADQPRDMLDSLSVLTLPLISRGQLTGLIYLDNHTIYGPFTQSDVDLLAAFANQAASAIENARLYQGLEQRVAERTAELHQANQTTEQRAAELSIINSVQQGLASQLDFQGIIELVGDKIREVFNWPNMGIRTYDPETNLVHYPYELERGVRLPPFDPLPAGAFSGHIIKTRKPLLINQDMDGWMEKLHSSLLPGTEQSKSFLGVPIISSDQVTGVIAVEDIEREDAFGETDVRLLTTLAASMGVALENARLFNETNRLLAETKQRAAELEIISSVEQALASKLDMQEVFDLVGDKIAQVFDTQVLVLLTYDSESDIATYRYLLERGRRHFPEPSQLGGKGFAAHIIRTRQSLMLNRELVQRMKEFGSFVLAGDVPKSYLGVPLIIGKDVKGVISLQNLDREDAFSESDQRLLTTLASSMTVALENVRLFDETRRRAAEMAALAEIAREVSATLDLSTVLTQIGTRAMELLHSRTAQVRLLAEDKQTLKSVVALGHNAEAFAATDMQLGEGISGSVAMTGRPEIINDPIGDAARAKHVPGTPVGDPTAFMVVPLAAGEAIIGTMGVWRLLERGLFTEEDLNLLVALGRQAAIAIGNARLFDQVEQEKDYSESLVQHSPVAIVNIDEQDIIVSWNPGAEKLFGYTAPEAIGRNIDDLLVTQELREEAVDYNRQVQADGRISVTTRRRRKDGTLVDVDLHGVPLQSDGKAAGAIAIYHDITERVRAEQELRRQKQYSEGIVQYSPVAIVTVDFDAKVVGWNPAAEKLFGYTAEEAIGRNVDEMVAKSSEFHTEAATFSDRGIRGDSFHAITRRTRKDGTLVDVELEGVPVIVGGDRVGMIAIYHDISELKRAEVALREQKEYLEAVVQNSPVAIVTIDQQANVVAWNPTAEKLFGYTAEEAIGHNIDELVADRDELRGEAVGYNRQAAGGELIRAITKRTRKDGTLLNVEVLALPVEVEGQQVGIIVIYHDISELIEARQSAEAANEAKSAFLATMSHEIRTPMNAVIGMSGLLLDTVLNDEQREFAEIIRNSGDSLLTIINDILDFSKIEAGKMELESQPFDLRECIESALDLVAPRAAEKGLELAYLLDEKVPQGVLGDVTRLRQILINLLGNAVKFTERGEVVLSVVAKRRAWAHDLHFSVRDTGVGITEDQIGRLFQSFSQADASTARKHGGTGLGLAISKRLAELMGGRMWAESAPGVGSVFHFTAVTQAAELPQIARPNLAAEQPLLVGKRVLIVDDNETNRRILVAQTQSWGMTPLETGSPRQAVDWIRRGESFDLAILDMHMPEMDGLALAKEIRQHRPSTVLPMVLFTSLGRREADLRGVDFAAQLTKPIKPSQLFDALIGVFAGAEEPAAAGDGRAKARMDPEMGKRHPLRILLAEDNAVNQKLALRLLQGMGYRADVAGNGLEAIQSLERQRYDVVLMDVQMPEMDGLEASREINRRWKPEQRPRIVAMTANAMQGDRELCVAAGMDDYIAKPIRVPELVGALSKATARQPEGA
ncbi:MAG: PAS domain S-box protein [Anaerolineales bacterium]